MENLFLPMICTSFLLKGISRMQFYMQICTRGAQRACLAHEGIQLKHVRVQPRIAAQQFFKGSLKPQSISVMEALQITHPNHGHNIGPLPSLPPLSNQSIIVTLNNLLRQTFRITTIKLYLHKKSIYYKYRAELN